MSRQSKSVIIVATLLAVFSVDSGWAADIEFTATSTGDWNVIGNWNNGSRVPTVGDTAIVKNTGTLLITQSHSVDALVVGQNGNGFAKIQGGTLSTANTIIGEVGCTVTFTQTNGAHVISSQLDVGKWANASGSYILSGGNLTANIERIGFRGIAHFSQQGGTNTVQDDLQINQESSSSCSYTLNDGLLSVGDQETVGWYGAGTFLQNGGTHTVGGQLRVGENAAGSFVLSNGMLTVTGDSFVGYSKTGTFEQRGGTNSMGNLSVGRNGTTGNGLYTLYGGKLTVTALNLAQASGSTGLFQLRGGELTVNSGIEAFNGAAAFDFLGGVLHAGYISMGTFTNQAGTLAPGTSIGDTTFYGNYEQAAGGTLQIELNSTSIDVIKNITAATLDGHLEVVLTDGFEPGAGWTSAPFLKTTDIGSGISGTFSDMSYLWAVVLSEDGREMSLERLAPSGTAIIIK